MNQIDIPITTAVPVGPGSQPAEKDGSHLDIMQLPQGMSTFSTPELPEKEDFESGSEALSLLSKLLGGIKNFHIDNGAIRFPINHLDSRNRILIDQILGEGEVSIVFDAQERVQIQESVLAGIWRVQYYDNNEQLISDHIEIATIPELIRDNSFRGVKNQLQVEEGSIPNGVLNAPALIAEINDKIKQISQSGQNNQPAHVINLTLLPQTEQDIAFLNQVLGKGVCTILSRGYGNCRISSTNTQNVWWVQYFNSQDSNILNSLEIVDIPNVACAAAEDIEDSAQRLEEILEAYR